MLDKSKDLVFTISEKYFLYCLASITPVSEVKFADLEGLLTERKATEINHSVQNQWESHSQSQRQKQVYLIRKVFNVGLFTNTVSFLFLRGFIINQSHHDLKNC